MSRASKAPVRWMRRPGITTVQQPGRDAPDTGFEQERIVRVSSCRCHEKLYRSRL
jgi:hypothetical protein